MIKGSFPILNVLVFEGNSYVCWKNEDIRLFYEGNSFFCGKNEKMILDNFMIAHGKECD